MARTRRRVELFFCHDLVFQRALCIALHRDCRMEAFVHFRDGTFDEEMND